LEALAIFKRRETAEGEAIPKEGLRGSTEKMREEGRFLPFGTRLVYAGPSLGDEDYRALESLKGYHLSLEYLVIDEKFLPPLGYANSRRYQMKEGGYEIL
jgi:hypothetical protein